MQYTGVRLINFKLQTVNIYDTIRSGIRGSLLSVLDDDYVKCKKKHVNPKYTGNGNDIKYLPFNASAKVQVLPPGETSVYSSSE